MKKGLFGWSVLAVAVLLLGIGCPAWGADVIKIGVIGPMQFTQGEGHWNGATMAADEINAHLLDHDILGGWALGETNPEMKNCLLIAVTEMNTRQEIDRLVDALAEASNV